MKQMVTLCLQSGSRYKYILVLSLLPLFIQSSLVALVLEMLQITIRVGLLSLLNLPGHIFMDMPRGVSPR